MMWVLTLVVGLTLVPACQVHINCPDVVPQAWWGQIDSAGIQFPGYNGLTVNGTMFRPADSKTYPGRRPVIVVDHGYAEDECHQWWTAEALAGHGYLVLTFTEPTPAFQVPDTENAINWLAANHEPFRDQADMTRLGLVGHSAGAEAVQVVQATDTRVNAFVALDNLRLTSFGCPDELGAPGGADNKVLPARTPGLGLAKDSDCTGQLEVGDPDFTTHGFDFLRVAGVPTAVFSFAGSGHFDFETAGPDLLHQRAFYAMDAWLDTWVAGNPAALNRIVSTAWNGMARSAILSPYYRSGVDTPAYECIDVRTTCPAAAPLTAQAQVHAQAQALSAPPAAAVGQPVALDQPQVLGPAGALPHDDAQYAAGN
jgi:hypothetical protein